MNSEVIIKHFLAEGKNVFSARPETSNHRIYAEKNGIRTCFARDRDRIIHSTAFRRLKGKTQVFMSPDDDHHRTRLTHTLEVSQVARTIGRYFLVDEDLTTAIALAHDLGHTPYGHIGEDKLNECMKDYGAFDHNAQTLKIVSFIEEQYPTFKGLNLTFETLDGILKHNGPIFMPGSYVSKFAESLKLDLKGHASFEAQTAAISDDVAYNHHDIDDGFRAGLFSLACIREIDYIDQVIIEVENEFTNITPNLLMREVVRRMLSAMVHDILKATEKNLLAINPRSIEEVKNCGIQIVKMSSSMFAKTKMLNEFLMKNVYRSEQVNEAREKAAEKIDKLFTYYLKNPTLLPNYKTLSNLDHMAVRAIYVADYVAGMTDAFADRQVRELEISHMPS